MRRVKNGLLILFTLALVAAGAVMPFLAAELEDAYGMIRQETRSFDSFSLTLREDSDLNRALRVMSSPYDVEAYGGETMLDEDMVMEAATGILEWMVKCGVLSQTSLEWLEWLGQPMISCWQFTVGENYAGPGREGDAAVVWDIEWSDLPYYFLRIDDSTGKMLMCAVQNPYFYDGSVTKSYAGNQSATIPAEDWVLAGWINDNPENIFNLADNWRLFLSDHYRVELALPEAMWYDDSVRFLFQMDLEDGKKPLPMVLTIYSSGSVIAAPDVS